MRSFELERPRVMTHLPKWNQASVLSSLSSAPFEPLDFCGFKKLTLKTVFLTALATGRRHSDFALSCSDVQFTDHLVDLLAFPRFWAKNQLPSVLSDRIVLP